MSAATVIADPVDAYKQATRAEVAQARRRFKAGDRSPETLILAHLPIAIAIARKYQGGSLDPEDLVGVANIGLVEAAASYDPTGAAFPSHAAVTIHRHLWRALREAAPVSIPTSSLTPLRRLRKHLQEAEDRGEQPDLEQIAQSLDITMKRLEELKGLVTVLDQPDHFDRLVSDTDGLTLGEMVAAPYSVEDEALEAIAREEAREELTRALKGLPEGVRVALGLNLGVPTFEGATVADVLTHGQQSRAKRARDRLRRAFQEGKADARRLGFEPGDAGHARKSGQRVLAGLSRLGTSSQGGRAKPQPADLWRRLTDSLREAAKVGPGRRLGA